VADLDAVQQIIVENSKNTSRAVGAHEAQCALSTMLASRRCESKILRRISAAGTTDSRRYERSCRFN
jgi:hypothetical protein